MPISSTEKKTVIQKYQKHEKDTGSPEVQIAVMSQRIASLTKHFIAFKKDNTSKRGLVRIIGRRKRLLNYLKKISPERYHAVVKKLDI
jgi:small subunit ribosomal protein S15